MKLNLFKYYKDELIALALFSVGGTLGMLGIFRKWRKKPAVLFDFDQTLAQTRGLIGGANEET